MVRDVVIPEGYIASQPYTLYVVNILYLDVLGIYIYMYTYTDTYIHVYIQKLYTVCVYIYTST